jgi:hypothetical protein
MKRLILILGITLIITLSVVWGYLLFFGTPESASNFFANFDFGNSEEVGVVETFPEVLSEEGVDGEVLALSQLRQLTTKPVVGYTEVTATTSSSTFVYYIEAGTGHIYSLDTITGTEIRLSNITVPNAQAGFIANNGRTAVIQSGQPGEGSLTVIELSGLVDKSTSYLVVNDAFDFTLTESGEVLYTTVVDFGLTAFSFRLDTKARANLFSLPFQEAVVRWGKTSSAEHYVFPKVATQLEGYLYKINSGSLLRLPLSGFGFSAIASSDLLLVNYVENNENESRLFDEVSNNFAGLGINIIPDKCGVTNHSQIFILCGVPDQNLVPAAATNDWQKGVLRFSDELWGIGKTGLEVETFFFGKLSNESSRELDVTQPNLFEGGNLYFINKSDRTLWTQLIETNNNEE